MSTNPAPHVCLNAVGIGHNSSCCINLVYDPLNHSPIVHDDWFDVPSFSAVNSFVGRVVAFDVDEYQTLSFTIIGLLFCFFSCCFHCVWRSSFVCVVCSWVIIEFMC